MSKKMKIGCLVAVIALGILAICTLVGFFWFGAQQYQDTPRLVSEFDFGSHQVDDFVYSNAQSDTIRSSGYPESFTILFYHTVDPSGNKAYVRYEEWFYPSAGKSLSFENGYFMAEKEIELYPAIPTRYAPASFTAFMNREQLASAAGIDEWFILPVEEELLVDADLYYAEGLTFGLQAGDLVYIEAVGFEDPNAPAIELVPEPAPTQAAAPEPQPSQAAAAEPAPAAIPEPSISSLTPEEQAAQGIYTYSVVLYEENSIMGCGSYQAAITIDGETLTLDESGDVLDFTQISENQYRADSNMGQISLTLTPTGYFWSGQEGGITFKVIAIREQAKDQQFFTNSGLTLEEMQSSGTHSYRIDYCMENEIFATENDNIEINFADNSLQMVESVGTTLFHRVGPNRYIEDTDDASHLLFMDKGIIWRFEDDTGDMLVIFTIQ